MIFDVSRFDAAESKVIFGVRIEGRGSVNVQLQYIDDGGTYIRIVTATTVSAARATLNDELNYICTAIHRVRRGIYMNACKCSNMSHNLCNSE